MVEAAQCSNSYVRRICLQFGLNRSGVADRCEFAVPQGQSPPEVSHRRLLALTFRSLRRPLAPPGFRPRGFGTAFRDFRLKC
jgi:hypothetical protein